MSINMSKKKKKVAVIIEVIICLCLVFIGVFYVSNNKDDKNVNNKNVVSQKTDVKKNEIDGFDIGVLTKDEFYKAMEIGKQYKGKSVRVEGVNKITNSTEQFKQTYGYTFTITTSYVKTIDYSKSVAEKYLEVTDKNVINEIKNSKSNLNTFSCVAAIGGNDLNFLKDLHVVLRIYGKSETKVLQPVETYFGDSSGFATMSPFFPDRPSYDGVIGGEFNAKDIVALEPQQLEIIVVYPDGKEVTQKFDYNKLSQL